MLATMDRREKLRMVALLQERQRRADSNCVTMYDASIGLITRQGSSSPTAKTRFLLPFNNRGDNKGLKVTYNQNLDLKDLKIIAPQPGPQEAFAATEADIAIYGGAAGAGKTYALLMEPLKNVTTNRDFGAVFFRRSTVEIKNIGGLWDGAIELYPQANGIPTQHVLEFNWPLGGKVKFTHLEHENTKLDWQGSQVPLIIFDELTHFSQSQFFYLVSRNRSTCGVRPYIRASCNPDADSWVASFISWWIDQETGFAIPERSGKIRWFVRLNDTIIWGDSRAELVEKYGRPSLPDDHEEQLHPKSVTFIPGKLSDNPALLKADPDYLANLKSLPLVEQARLLGGNWKIRPAAGLLFNRSWVEIIDIAPANIDWVRYWDLAATKKTDDNDPDWTVGVKLGKIRGTGTYVIGHAQRDRENPGQVRTIIKNTASADGKAVRIGVPQDPGQAGKSQAQDMIADLQGYNAKAMIESGDKITRFSPFSAQCLAGNVKVLRGMWNEDFFTSLESFPDAKHKDDADACSGAYNMHLSASSGLMDYYREEARKLKEQGQ